MRAIVTKKDAEKSFLRFQSGGSDEAKPKDQDKYLARVIKYIPAEVVSIYVAIHQTLEQLKPDIPGIFMLLGIAGMTVLNYYYLKKVGEIERKSHLIISCFAFLIWVYFLDGQATKFLGDLHQPAVAGILIALFSAIPAMFNLEK